MSEIENGEKMIPLSAVAPLLGHAAAQITLRPDPALRECYDHAATALGLPSCKEILSSHLGLKDVIQGYAASIYRASAFLQTP